MALSRATKARNAMSMAATFSARCSPSVVPRAAASMTFTSVLSIFRCTSPAVLGFPVSGTNILARRRVPGAVMITAVIMTAPGTLLLAKMFVPETGKPRTAGDVHLKIERTDVNVIDAAARGTTEGLHLALNVAAMLIAFLALVALLNAILGIVPMGGGEHLSLQWIFGRVAAPLAWLMGVPWKDCFQVGNLLATRLVLNELIAYSQLGPLKASLDPRSFVIATFALCGFANLSSIGIQIGGIGALAPERRHDLARLGFRAVAAGTLANYLSASIAGILL